MDSVFILVIVIIAALLLCLHMSNSKRISQFTGSMIDWRQGTYTRTCRGASLSGTTLTAICKNRQGQEVSSTLDIRDCIRTPDNIDGNLYCFKRGSDQGPPHLQGSYVETCTDIALNGSTLTAQCFAMDGTKKNTTLNTSTCPNIRYINNIDGQLECGNIPTQTNVPASSVPNTPAPSAPNGSPDGSQVNGLPGSSPASLPPIVPSSSSGPSSSDSAPRIEYPKTYHSSERNMKYDTRFPWTSGKYRTPTYFTYPITQDDVPINYRFRIVVIFACAKQGENLTNQINAVKETLFEKYFRAKYPRKRNETLEWFINEMSFGRWILNEDDCLIIPEPYVEFEDKTVWVGQGGNRHVQRDAQGNPIYNFEYGTPRCLPPPNEKACTDCKERDDGYYSYYDHEFINKHAVPKGLSSQMLAHRLIISPKSGKYSFCSIGCGSRDGGYVQMGRFTPCTLVWGLANNMGLMTDTNAHCTRVDRSRPFNAASMGWHGAYEPLDGGDLTYDQLLQAGRLVFDIPNRRERPKNFVRVRLSHAGVLYIEYIVYGAGIDANMGSYETGIYVTIYRTDWQRGTGVTYLKDVTTVFTLEKDPTIQRHRFLMEDEVIFPKPIKVKRLDMYGKVEVMVA